MKFPKYHNADICKAKILSDNQNKSGIYKWKNKINGKQYIGSSINLSKRLQFYYSNSSRKALLKRSQSHVCSALLKHGTCNFSLEILEYCEPEKCLEREDYYLKKLKPEYNISLNPSAPFSGRKHSDESKTIMSDANTGQNNPMFGKNHTEETKTIMSDAKKGEKNPNYDKPRTEGWPSQQIEVTDIKNNKTTTYDSISEAARTLNINQSTITNYILRNQQKPYKGIYSFKKV